MDKIKNNKKNVVALAKILGITSLLGFFPGVMVNSMGSISKEAIKRAYDLCPLDQIKTPTDNDYDDFVNKALEAQIKLDKSRGVEQIFSIRGTESVDSMSVEKALNKYHETYGKMPYSLDELREMTSEALNEEKIFDAREFYYNLQTGFYDPKIYTAIETIHREIRDAIKEYKAKRGMLPTSYWVLEHILGRKMPKDPWGYAYWYDYQGDICYVGCAFGKDSCREKLYRFIGNNKAIDYYNTSERGYIVYFTLDDF